MQLPGHPNTYQVNALTLSSINRSSWWLRATLLFVFFSWSQVTFGKVNKFRLTWREDPSTTMVIGWDQVSGSNPRLLYDTKDYGSNFKAYTQMAVPARVVKAKGMNNHFVRLTGLRPNTMYYFVVQDSEGVSRRFSFKTAPNKPDARLSIIAGGDSRNNRPARQDANKLVGKLRPNMVLFSGDMTNGDTGEEWKNWMNDWQLTIGGDGHFTPIVIARGNHEKENQTLIDLFDVKNPGVYYALSFGGNLLRVYSLNTMIPAEGNQRAWLERDLNAHQQSIWKVAQYHNTIRPHTARKQERNDLLQHWAPLFYKKGVNLVIESDAHVVKSTWPIRPSTEPGSAEGFIRDDDRGTVYVGEGCWGAPLRTANDNKPWTRDMASFNQFRWIFIDRNKIEVRTIKTDGADRVGAVDPNNVFKAPYGLVVWSPSQGEVITIHQPLPQTVEEPDQLYVKDPLEVGEFTVSQENNQIVIRWASTNEPEGVNYMVQRSLNKGPYETIHTIPGKGKVNNKYDCLDIDQTANYEYVAYRVMFNTPDGRLEAFEGIQVRKKTRPGPPSPPSFPKLQPDMATGTVKVAYDLPQAGDVKIAINTPALREVSSLTLPAQSPGRYLKSIDISKIPKGRYLLTISVSGKIIKRYRLPLL